MKLMSARGAQQTRDQATKLNMYSKTWLPGDTLHVYYPLYWEDGQPEIAIGAIWGHSVNDIKALGLKTSFIPSTTQFNEEAQPIGQPDITYQFAQIAPVFVRGMKADEEAVILKKKWPTEASRREALTALEAKYDSKNNMKAVKPIIAKAKYYISTEVVCVKFGPGGPDPKSVAHVSCPLSGKIIRALYQLMDKPQYRPEPGAEFLEVEWAYPVNTDKAASARDANPAGVDPQFKIENQYEDCWRTVKGALESVSRDADTIVRRATRSVDPAKVRNALTQYSIINSEFLDNASEEDTQFLLNNCEVVHELNIVDSLTNDKLIEAFKTKLAEADALKSLSQAAVTSVPEQVPTPNFPTQEIAPEMPIQDSAPIEQPAPATDVPPLQAVSGAPDLQSLLTNVNNLGAGDDNFDLGIDMNLE